eukprot:94419-Rhodomonas_salina.1
MHSHITNHRDLPGYSGTDTAGTCTTIRITRYTGYPGTDSWDWARVNLIRALRRSASARRCRLARDGGSRAG